MRIYAPLLILTVLAGMLLACENINQTPTERFVSYMQRCVQAQLYFKEGHGNWAGDNDHDNNIGDTGFSDGDSVHMLRSHDLNFTLTLDGSVYLFRYGMANGRGNAVFAVFANNENPQPMPDVGREYCRSLDNAVDGYEDGSSGRVLGYRTSRLKWRPGSGTYETTGMPQGWDSGELGACVMLLE